MHTKTKLAVASIATAAMLAGSTLIAGPAAAAPFHGPGMGTMTFAGPGGGDWWMRRGGHWHHGGNGWIGPAIGFGAGVAVGSALAYPYYGYGPYYDYGPSYVYNDADAWCAARYRTYDPVTHTYTGYDGLPHPCP